ncbi:hypothetical protein NMG60_11033611 [Bertholletia excelsa]
MSSFYTFPPIAITFLVVLVFQTALSQSQSPFAGDCGPRLLPLIPCAPFLQGTSAALSQPCCDNVNRLYTQEQTCLCLLLNGTLTFSNFNATLAQRVLPLCNLKVSICSEGHSNSTSPISPGSSETQLPNSTVAASPVVTVTPRPGSLGFGFGFGQSHSTTTKMKAHSVLLLIAFQFSVLLL